MALHLNKVDFTTQGCFVQSLVEIGHVVLEKKIFKFRHCTNIFAFCNFIPLKKSVALHLNKLVENVKSLQTGGETQDDR